MTAAAPFIDAIDGALIRIEMGRATEADSKFLRGLIASLLRANGSDNAAREVWYGSLPVGEMGCYEDEMKKADVIASMFMESCE